MKRFIGFAVLSLAFSLTGYAQQPAPPSPAPAAPAPTAKPSPPHPLPANVKSLSAEEEAQAREMDKQIQQASQDEQTAAAQYRAAQATRVALQQAQDNFRLRLLMKAGVSDGEGWSITELVDKEAKTSRIVLAKAEPKAGQ